MKKLKINKKYLLISLIIITFIAITITILICLKPHTSKIVPNSEERATSQLSAHEIYDKNKDINLATIDASKNDYSALLVKDGAIVTLRDSSIKKYNGLISDSSKLEEIGLNSTIVVSYGSQLKITNSKIETSVDYTNGIYVSGQKTKTYIIDTNINGYGIYNNGVVVATSGYLEMEHSNILTKFKSSPAIVVKSHKGQTVLNNVMLETTGGSSPLFKSSGTISITDSTGTANGSRFAVLNGGTLTVKSTTLISAGASNNDTEEASGFQITGKEHENIINLTDSSLNINSKMPYYKTAIMFDIKSATSTLNLKNSQLNYGSNKLIKLADSELTINCDNQTLDGDFELDKTSNLNINLKNNSLIMGAISSDSRNNVKLNLDSTSKLILTEDTYLKELTNEITDNANINFNNHKLYVNGIEIN